MNADGSSQTNLTDHSGIDYDPCWSPDGTKIVFTTERDGNNEIYLMDLNGTILKRLMQNSYHDAFTLWSPDETTIVFESDRSSKPNIREMNATDGSSATRLTVNEAFNRFVCWYSKYLRALSSP